MGGSGSSGLALGKQEASSDPAAVSDFLFPVVVASRFRTRFRFLNFPRTFPLARLSLSGSARMQRARDV